MAPWSLKSGCWVSRLALLEMIAVASQSEDDSGSLGTGWCEGPVSQWFLVSCVAPLRWSLRYVLIPDFSLDFSRH